MLNQGNPIAADNLRPWLQGSTQNEAANSENDAVGSCPEGLTLDEMERRLIVTTLQRCDGHRAKAAEVLGIGLRTLSGKLRAYGYAPREKDFAKAG